MLRPRHAEERRRAVILIVVLALLTVFAIVGITFVFYAQKNHSASVNFRESSQGGTVGGPDIDPSILFRWGVGQLLFDTDDGSGVQSGLRGHSFARTMYGYNDQVLNIQPYNGTGRLHYIQPATAGVFANNDDYQLVNYTFFKTSGWPNPPDGILRDPERIGTRTDPTNLNARGPYTGGFNASYTYPDLNSLFLGVSKADGTLLMPSFHRPWLFGPLPGVDPTTGTPTNQNLTNALGKYMTLRPRPMDQLLPGETGLQYDQASGQWLAVNPTTNTTRPAFGYPSDAGGDVKNRSGAPRAPDGSNNDSIWVDLGYPVVTAADGTKFKPLFAYYIEDLDNRINLNTAGNLMGVSPSGGPGHSSNRGLGKWEVSLAQLLSSQRDTNEWRNLFVGNASTAGRYGRDGLPTKTGISAPSIYAPRFFAQVDSNGADETNSNAPTGRITLPTALSPFPTFPGGYDNGSSAALTNHAQLYDYFQPGGPVPPNTPPLYDDTFFPATDMRKLMYSRGGGSEAMSSVVATLCPQNFTTADPTAPDYSANLRRRQMVTTLSMDVNRLGLAPWLFDRQNSGYAATQDNVPAGPATAFPPLTARSGQVPSNSDFAADWRSKDALLEKINLDQPLPRYPHQYVDASGNRMLGGNGGNGYNGRYDNPNAVQAPYTLTDVQNQFQLAQSARQNLADAIYRRLLAVTGAPAPDPTRMNSLTQPTDDELARLRWLGQLAVNIVDYIDEDEIVTPFNFYATAYNYFAIQQGLPQAQQNLPVTSYADSSGNNNTNEQVLKYWVFGTELPPVVLNEALVEYQLPPGNANGNFEVQVWAELYSPFPATVANAGTQQQDTQKIPLYHPAVQGNNAPAGYSIYKIEIATTDTDVTHPYRPLLNVRGNVAGTPSAVRTSADFTTQTSPPTTRTVGNANANASMAVDPASGGFFLVGPDANNSINSPNTRNNSISPPPAPDNVPARRPGIRRGACGTRPISTTAT